MSLGFNKSKSKSTQQSQSTSASLNQAYPYLQQTYAPVVEQGNQASNLIANLLGLNGAQGQDEGFNKFRDSAGYKFAKDEGVNSITGSAAAKGLLNSGSALKAITNYSSDLARKFLDSYLANLGGLSNKGVQAGQIIGSAGNTANSQSTGMGSSTGSSMGFSIDTRTGK